MRSEESTKGSSNLYGNNAGVPTEHINYPYAQCFNPATLSDHYYRHGRDVGAESMLEYEGMAIDFANDVNNVTHDSFVDEHGTTYKYSYETGEFVIVEENGTVITYFIPAGGDSYWEEVLKRHGR